MEKKPHILICDDNIAIHESLSAYLIAENMECESAYDGEDALSKIRLGHFDLLILDIMLPKMFGTDVCREIRKTSDIPVIMLSARGEEFDRILGLELGADDYITKPFSPRELAVRVRTILKRSKPRNESKIIVICEMIIDTEAYTVTVNNQLIDLTPKQVDVLKCLSHPQLKVSRGIFVE